MVNGSRSEICFAVVGGQVHIGNDEQPLTRSMELKASMMRQDSTIPLPSITTNELGRFYEVIPYDILPGTVKGNYPHEKICFKAGKGAGEEGCYEIGRSIIIRLSAGIDWEFE